MNRLLAAIYLLFFLGCSKPAPRPKAQPKAKPQVQVQVTGSTDTQKTQSFFSEIPEFREFSLTMTEAEMEMIIYKNDLLKTVSDNTGQTVYRVFRQDGQNMIVTFRDGTCVGIQRMPRDIAGIPKPVSSMKQPEKSLESEKNTKIKKNINTAWSKSMMNKGPGSRNLPSVK